MTIGVVRYDQGEAHPDDVPPNLPAVGPILTTNGKDVLAEVRQNLVNKTQKPIFATGFDVELTPGQAIVMGGQPGSGKTTLVLQMVFEALERQKDLRAVVGSVEMPNQVIIEKQISRLSGIPANKIRWRDFDGGSNLDEAYARLERICKRIEFLAPPFSMSRLEKSVRDTGAKLVLIDYLQRFTPHDESKGDMRSMVSEVMSRIRSNLCDDDVAVLIVSSLNRTNTATQKVTDSYNHNPHLGMFRESSEIEYGVDDAYFLQVRDPNHRTMVHLKSRYGFTQSFTMEFLAWKAEFVTDMVEVGKGFDAEF